MRQTITISCLDELRRFKREFVKLVDVVKGADGKYVLYLDIVTPNGAQPSIISKSEFDRVVSPAMHKNPSAFSERTAGGRFLPDKLDAAYGALARAQARHAGLCPG